MSPPDTIIGNLNPSLANPEAPSKRRRLNFACNYCRSRKSRCDEQKPSCRACLNAGIPCVTVDRRRPGVAITRHEAGGTSDSQIPANPAVQTNTRRCAAIEASGEAIPVIIPPMHHRRPSLAVPLTPRSASEFHEETQHDTSWKPQTYGNSRNADPTADMHAETDHVNQTTRYSGRLPILRPSTGSCTSELLTDWLDLAFQRLGIKKRFSSLLLSAESSGSIQKPSLQLDTPTLPDPATSQELLFLYLEEINAVFPLLDAANTSQLLDLAIQLGPTQFTHDHGFLPLLIIYVVLSLGALGHDRKEWREFSAGNLDYCKNFVGHMTGWNNLQTVQLLFLMSLCFKAHDQITAAWSALSLCVSMAMSQGLNRPVSTPRRPSTQSLAMPDLEVDRLRTWWCIFCLERLLAFELGRQPLIFDESCQELDLGSWSFSTNGRGHPRPSFLRILGQFAGILGEIGRSAVRSRNTEETSGSSGIDGAIRDKVKTIGESCAKLMKWADGLPEEYRPRSDFIYDPGSFPFASFIALQYNQSLLMLMRNSLLVSSKAIQLAIDNVAVGKPWEYVIRKGPSIVANAARRTVQLLIEASESELKPLLPSLSAPLHALYVLSIIIITNPKSRMAKSDLNFIHDAADFAKQQGELSSTNSKLQGVLDKLESLVKKVISNSGSIERRLAAVQHSGTATPGSMSSGTAVADTAAPQNQATHSQLGGPHSLNRTPMDLMNIDFTAVFGESPTLSHDAGLSPEVTRDIGWDWVEFAHLFPESLGAT
ncbi:hypothetical protein BKA67DRAFT_655336 [Truncatella angustata]|uniref:Zn(2)-C6 fungal-type domain-containing protein n=1 Tax=Truncatella angustata TaxID=152316 RepID=A0A9P8URB9_9PEZI|nr:uncharacterized protein BKA67DRAFT_655336 [Truncatella angustata]KAH6657042.1 hypothetical protein BKA67DRAFT_655336 [Truncatella angustata]